MNGVNEKNILSSFHFRIDKDGLIRFHCNDELKKDDFLDAQTYLKHKENISRKNNVYKAIIYFVLLIFILIFFTSCGPKNNTPCGGQNQYQCVRQCDGLWSKRQANWVRYFESELDCNVERNPVHEIYE